MNDYIEVKEIFSITFRRLWLVIGFVIIGAGCGYLISQNQSPVYEATTTVLVGDILGSTDLNRTDILTSELVATTYAEMVRRQPVLEGVVNTLGLDGSWRQLKNQVKVNLVEGTQLINIIVEAPSPLAAQQIVDEIANQVISFSPSRNETQGTVNTQTFVQQQLEVLQARLEAGQNKRIALDAKLVTALSTESLDAIQTEIEVLDALITEWETNYTQLLLFLGDRQSPNNLTIIEPAQASANQVRPNVRLYLLIGSGVGLFLALGLIFLLEYFDDRVKSVDELIQEFDSLILGTIPKMKGLDFEKKMAVFQDHLSFNSEVFRMIGGNLHLYSSDTAQKTLMITSPNQSEGKSLIIASLGTVLAQSGLSTIIVDANLRRPIVHEIFKVENEKGLMDLLGLEEYNISDYLMDTQLEKLKLLTIGASEINPSGLLNQQKINQIIYALKKQADVVLFDSSSVLEHADSRFLSAQMDGVIMVIAAKRTKIDQVKRSIQNLDLSNAKISGVIFNQYLPGKIVLLLTRIRASMINRGNTRFSDRPMELDGTSVFAKISLKLRGKAYQTENSQ